MNKKPDSRLWGVLGKQQTYYSPLQFLKGKTKVPLNASPFESWDSKRSKYYRVDGWENAVQQGGVVPQEPPVSPTPTPTITQTSTPTNTPTQTQTQTSTPTQTQTQTNTPTSSLTPSPTPSFTQTSTPTQTQTQTKTPTATPTLTPSSTPYPLPSTPLLWYDATNVGSIDYITSGGTNYVSGWRSIGTIQKYMSGTTTDTMPIWSASTLFPGSPLVVRFTKNTTAGLRDFLSQRFDTTEIPSSGLTAYFVFAKPTEYNYSGSANTNGFGFQLYLYSGNTTTGGFTPVSNFAPRVYNNNINTGNDSSVIQLISSGSATNNTYSYSATNLNNKFLLTHVVPYPSGFPYMEINQSATTFGNQITATTTTNFNSIILGGAPVSGGTVSVVNNGVEIAEIMIFGSEMTVQQQEAVQNYLKDKWSYDSWSSPVPTPTQTPSPTQTATQTLTPTQTATQTLTPTPSTTPPFNPANLNPSIWLDFNDKTTITLRSGTNFLTNITNKGTFAGLTGFSQSVAANQPLVGASTYFTGTTGLSAATISNDILQANNLSLNYGSNWTTVYVFGGTNAVPLSPPAIAWFVTSNNSQVASYTHRNANSSALRKGYYEGSSGRYWRVDCSGTSLAWSGLTIGEYVSTSATTIQSYSYFNTTGATETLSGGDSPADMLGLPGLAGLYMLNQTGATENIAAEIGEIIMLNRELTSTEKTNLLAYLKNKWKITY